MWIYGWRGYKSTHNRDIFTTIKLNKKKKLRHKGKIVSILFYELKTMIFNMVCYRERMTFDFAYEADDLVSLLCVCSHVSLPQGTQICPLYFAWPQMSFIYWPIDAEIFIANLQRSVLFWALQILSGDGRDSGLSYGASSLGERNSSNNHVSKCKPVLGDDLKWTRARAMSRYKRQI